MHWAYQVLLPGGSQGARTYFLTTGAGRYMLSGQQTSARTTRRLVCGDGSFVSGWFGQLRRVFALASGCAFVQAAGRAAATLALRRVHAAATEFRASGPGTGLNVSHRLEAVTVDFASQGQPAMLHWQKMAPLVASAGVFAHDGQIAAPRCLRHMSALTGMIVCHGQATGGSPTPGSSWSLGLSLSIGL